MTNSNSALIGRTVVITGAASGMGAATAGRLASQGARVALLSRRKDRLDELAHQVRTSGGEAMVLAVDVTDSQAVVAAAERIDAAWGPVDTVINAAGVMLAAPIDDGRTDHWARMIDTNLSGTLHVIRASHRLCCVPQRRALQSTLSTSRRSQRMSCSPTTPSTRRRRPP